MNEGNLARNLQTPESAATEKPRRELPKPRWQQEKELESTEIERRKKIGETVEAANNLDAETRRFEEAKMRSAEEGHPTLDLGFNSNLPSPDFAASDLSKLIEQVDSSENQIFQSKERIKTLQTLSSGKETARKALGDEAGINAISRRTYEGNPPRTAYVKPKSGETMYRHDPTTNTTIQYQERWNPTTKKFEEISAPLDLRTASTVGRYSKEAAPRRRDVAACYGIAPEEVPLRDNEMGVRFGLPPGESAVREYVVSRISDLVGLNVVPQTVLRSEPDNMDLCSVQEAVTSTNPEKPVRPMDGDDFDLLRIEGPKHAGAKSFMRIACLDYLVQSLDRHHNNVLVDPETNTFHAIDNGATLGLSERNVISQPDGSTKNEDVPMDALISLPLEIVMEHPDWTLDEKSLTEMKTVYQSMVDYLQKRETLGREGAAAASEGAGKEIKYLSKLMKLVFGNEKIAKKEALSFMQRLGELVSTGRPPDLISKGRLALKSDELLGRV